MKGGVKADPKMFGLGEEVPLPPHPQPGQVRFQPDSQTPYYEEKGNILLFFLASPVGMKRLVASGRLELVGRTIPLCPEKREGQ